MAQDTTPNTASSSSTPAASAPAAARPTNVTSMPAKPAAETATAAPKAAAPVKAAAPKPAAKKPVAKAAKKAAPKAVKAAAPKKAARIAKPAAAKKPARAAVKAVKAAAKVAAPKAAPAAVKSAARAANDTAKSLFGKGFNPQSIAFSLPSLSGVSLANNPIKSKMEDLMAQSQVNFEQFAQQAAEQGQQGVEAMVKSANIWARGCEDMVKTCMTFAQDASERNTNAFKTLLGCKTLNELTEAQNQIAQQAYDDMVTSATRLSEISTKIATETVQPLSEQINKAIKKVTNIAA